MVLQLCYRRLVDVTVFRYRRAMELCQELNILSGVSHHEKCAGYLLLTEQEQAK